MQKTMSDEQRFWLRVKSDAPDKCWLWGGKPSNNGYGTFRVGSLTDGTRRQVTPHRYVCEMAKRQFLPGEQALHHCDNKMCVNPHHLYIGTPKDNGRDASERGRTGGCAMPGAINPNAKLTEAQALEIRTSSEMPAALARKYGISKTHVSWIRSGKSWAHLSGG